MKHFLTLAALALAISTAQADVAPSHAAAIERLFTALKVDKQYDATLVAGFESGLGMGGDQLKSLPQEQQDKFNNAITKVKAKLMEMLGWEKIKGDMIEVYARTFTEKEAADIAAMMESPTGQLLASRQVTLVSEVIKMSQDKLKGIMPEVMKIMQEEMMK